MKKRRLTKRQQRLVTDNVGLVFMVLGRTSGPRHYHDRNDLLSYLYEGLCSAAYTFDKKRGIKFSTYATSAIRSHVYRYFKARGRVTRRHCYDPKFMDHCVVEFPGEHEVDWGALMKLLDCARLTDREIKVLVWRYCNNEKLREIGDRLGVTKQMAQIIIRRAHEKLDELLVDEEVGLYLL